MSDTCYLARSYVCVHFSAPLAISALAPLRVQNLSTYNSANLIAIFMKLCGMIDINNLYKCAVLNYDTINIAGENRIYRFLEAEGGVAKKN